MFKCQLVYIPDDLKIEPTNTPMDLDRIPGVGENIEYMAEDVEIKGRVKGIQTRGGDIWVGIEPLKD